MRPGNIAKQKSVESRAGAASLLIGRWREPLRLTLHVSMRKKLHSLYHVRWSTSRCAEGFWSETPTAWLLITMLPLYSLSHAGMLASPYGAR